MPPVTAFDVSIDLDLRGLRTLKALLTKACSHAAAATLPSAKSPNDSASLAFHVQSCTNLAVSGLGLLTGTPQEPPEWTTEGVTLEQLISLVDKTIAQLEGGATKPADLLDGVEDRELQVTYGNGQTAAWGGREYVLGYGIPNFMFHLCMAFSALRSQGVDAGKMDFLGPFMGLEEYIEDMVGEPADEPADEPPDDDAEKKQWRGDCALVLSSRP
ncbi:hypothetical protein B0T26DRAFT_752916 [Lasiosphaeria miniovina]|uniref:DUF1993 domain-containing protein n=1 Tax=Lasiosphaeria miniovina TaxID=1954250 RepID=A0AA40DRC7_9PEZI|nr:uncharacterized protein B0T26DRAFT_752916 [Lasiosphaeria miniovina]KAK0712715.1 hypothetical protein B0T26DRAFT_752916 [Lasiosphaeria miniovina]